MLAVFLHGAGVCNKCVCNLLITSTNVEAHLDCVLKQQTVHFCIHSRSILGLLSQSLHGCLSFVCLYVYVTTSLSVCSCLLACMSASLHAACLTPTTKYPWPKVTAQRLYALPSYDPIVNAKLPDTDTYFELFALISKFMIHRDSGKNHPSCLWNNKVLFRGGIRQ